MAFGRKSRDFFQSSFQSIYFLFFYVELKHFFVPFTISPLKHKTRTTLFVAEAARRCGGESSLCHGVSPMGPSNPGHRVGRCGIISGAICWFYFGWIFWGAEAWRERENWRDRTRICKHFWDTVIRFHITFGGNVKMKKLVSVLIIIEIYKLLHPKKINFKIVTNL